MKLLLVALGGALGSVARYGVSVAQLKLAGPGFPWSTVFVNVVGCFALAMIGVASTKGLLSDDARLLLGTGVCGGFTTYSTFNAEAIALFDGSPGRAAAYIAATIVGCALAGLAGIAIARAVV